MSRRWIDGMMQLEAYEWAELERAGMLDGSYTVEDIETYLGYYNDTMAGHLAKLNQRVDEALAGISPVRCVLIGFTLAFIFVAAASLIKSVTT